MELSGEEKKLQALFSELKAADEETAPRFARVWNRAARKPRRAFVFNPALIAAMGLVICAVIAFAVWSRYRQPAAPPEIARVAAPTEVPAIKTDSNKVQEPKTPPTLATSKEMEKPKKVKATVRGTSAQLAANRKLTREAKAMTDWESPTSALLSSPSDELFSSLPQLNENANGLQSFLPSRPN